MTMHQMVMLPFAAGSPPATYILRDTASDLGGGADFSNKLLTTTAPQAQIIIGVLGNATEVSRGFTEPGVPGADGLNSSFAVEMDISSGNTNIKLSVQVHRINATGAVLASSSITAEQDATVGVHTFSIAPSGLGSWSSGERLRVDYRFRNSNPVEGTTAILVNTTNAEVVVS